MINCKQAFFSYLRFCLNHTATVGHVSVDTNLVLKNRQEEWCVKKEKDCIPPRKDSQHYHILSTHYWLLFFLATVSIFCISLLYMLFLY
jgi:hypothetical protein